MAHAKRRDGTGRRGQNLIAQFRRIITCKFEMHAGEAGAAPSSGQAEDPPCFVGEVVSGHAVEAGDKPCSGLRRKPDGNCVKPVVMFETRITEPHDDAR